MQHRLALVLLTALAGCHAPAPTSEAAPTEPVRVAVTVLPPDGRVLRPMDHRMTGLALERTSGEVRVLAAEGEWDGAPVGTATELEGWFELEPGTWDLFVTAQLGQWYLGGFEAGRGGADPTETEPHWDELAGLSYCGAGAVEVGGEAGGEEMLRPDRPATVVRLREAAVVLLDASALGLSTRDVDVEPVDAPVFPGAHLWGWWAKYDPAPINGLVPDAEYRVVGTDITFRTGPPGSVVAFP
ncbi:hypothetical protein Pla163_03410 [Planctomycetes bacterium Pla163]|uniref:Uncharacterized protein n=1 Tax=Rohdeia mirabilis TaxID=2528008 RepID=A0A518CVI4_9BACT|nr:hypothetical protein Pla163_03410 [Planctomycetes bacterium Pla163]